MTLSLSFFGAWTMGQPATGVVARPGKQLQDFRGSKWGRSKRGCHLGPVHSDFWDRS